MSATIAIQSAAPARERGRIRRTLFQGRKKYLALLLALLLVPGAAYAAWTVSAHGKGAGKVGTLQAPSVSEGAPSADLLPGADGSATFTIVNPNPMALNVVDVDAGPDGITSSDQAACPASNLSINSLRGQTITVPKGSSTVSVPGAYHLSSSAPSSCQGVTFSADTALGFST